MKLVTVVLFLVVVLYVVSSVNAQGRRPPIPTTRRTTPRPTRRTTTRPTRRTTTGPTRHTTTGPTRRTTTGPTRRTTTGPTRRTITGPTRRTMPRPTRRTTTGPSCDDYCLPDVQPVCGTVFREGRFINCNFSNQCNLDNHSCRRREVWISRSGNCAQKSSNRDCA
ncbi:integumentary mucin C.1-like [Drosophila nasuta]|uniref:integumentary mucin C.1-like n=1 Tax=Drosophila nasuta TaxID=42062 RepID=UPI00295F3C3B|nr:integumentary mucin C.1-like [Drosophila nasuta]